MSSISVQPASGPAVAYPVKTGANSTASASTNETNTTSTTQGKAAVLYPSPIESIDPGTSQVVIEYRDNTSGEADYQTPSKAQLRLYQVNQSRVDIPGQVPTSAVPESTSSTEA